jgi:hypothetical protein
LEAPYIYDQITGMSHGWYIQQNQFEDTYKAFSWLETNTTSSELILNDLTMSSTYIDGLSIRNLSHSYVSGFLKYPPAATHPHLVMSQELKKVWQQPYDQQLVKGLLDKYRVEYIFLTPMPGFQDYANWGGDGTYKTKIFTNQQYKSFFDSYPFMERVFESGQALIYAVS